jgi:diadenosine tetraphosphate (Ap4A) HIT family hydrolase
MWLAHVHLFIRLRRFVAKETFMFDLHPQLHADTLHLGNWPLCHVALMNDKNYPWLILVPRRDDIVDIHELESEDQLQLIHEISVASAVLKEQFQAQKTNIAALGNMVPQMHVHVIARFHTDPAWPGPVWGKAPSIPYDAADIHGITQRLTEALAKIKPFMAS